MPWKGITVSDLRVCFVHHVEVLGFPVAEACRGFEISRKTGYKWLKRHRSRSGPLVDLSRRPKHSPRRTAPALEAQILQVRDKHRWGPRKIHAYLTLQLGLALPSARTVANVLSRHGRIHSPQPTPAAVQFFERPEPNDLWQCDFKGPLEVARRRISTFAVIDDHSRFLLALRACMDVSMASAWNVLWDAFGEYGLPRSILCDNAFGSTMPHIPGVSWFESQLIRLGIAPIHGRPYHPQTQGKIERLNGTLELELWPIVRRDLVAYFDTDLRQWRSGVYNSIRPHEALGDLPPATRWRPSPRKRPASLPLPEYPAGSIVRKVSTSGDARWNYYRFLAGRGLVGQYVRFEEREHEIAIFYCWKEIRNVPRSELKYGEML